MDWILSLCGDDEEVEASHDVLRVDEGVDGAPVAIGWFSVGGYISRRNGLHFGLTLTLIDKRILMTHKFSQPRKTFILGSVVGLTQFMLQDISSAYFQSQYLTDIYIGLTLLKINLKGAK